MRVQGRSGTWCKGSRFTRRIAPRSFTPKDRLSVGLISRFISFTWISDPPPRFYRLAHGNTNQQPTKNGRAWCGLPAISLRAGGQYHTKPSLTPSLRSGSVAKATLCHAESKPNHHNQQPTKNGRAWCGLPAISLRAGGQYHTKPSLTPSLRSGSVATATLCHAGARSFRNLVQRVSFHSTHCAKILHSQR